MRLSLGIDIGTSGIRTAIIDMSGEPISMMRVNHRKQNPDFIKASYWWSSVRDCIRMQLEHLEKINISPKKISHIAVDGTSGSMVLTDSNLTPVTRALMYNSKGFEAEASIIEKFAPSTHITRGSSSALGRAMRLISEDKLNRSNYLLHQADFIACNLLGRGGFSDHNNALKLGYDPELNSWPNWIQNVIDKSLLPDVRPVGSLLGKISLEVADSLGLPKTAQIYAGTTDSIAAFFATAPLKNGNAVTSLGSTLAIKVLSKTRIDDPEIGLYSHRIGDAWLVGGASNTGGAVLANFFTQDELKNLSNNIDTSTHTGLNYYPLLNKGERFPINNPNLEPQMSPRPTSKTVFLKAIFEGIADIEAKCYESIKLRGGQFPDKIYTAGGGAKNQTFTNIRANCLGVKLSQAQRSEAAIGVARIALLE